MPFLEINFHAFKETGHWRVAGTHIQLEIMQA